MPPEPTASLTRRNSSRVPVEVLSDALAESGISNNELARRLGWYRKGSSSKKHLGMIPDESRVARTLGRRPQNMGHGYGTSTRRHVNAATAAKIVEALNA